LSAEEENESRVLVLWGPTQQPAASCRYWIWNLSQLNWAGQQIVKADNMDGQPLSLMQKLLM
jgi:hypothetical protein